MACCTICLPMIPSQKSAHPSHFPEVVTTTHNCIESVNEVDDGNKLKMNNDKTEILPMATVHNLGLVSPSPSLALSDTVLPFSSKVKDLAVLLDCSLSMDSQVSSICSRSAAWELRRLRQIRSFLTVEAATKLACSFILSRLDYCNSLLVKNDEGQLDRPQHIQTTQPVSFYVHANKTVRNHYFSPSTGFQSELA